ncbi:MAG: metalloregulator ArsR/SmtB family transcription factor [bacterium]
MDITTSIEIMKSLADTSRLRVLNILLDKPQYVEELANKLNLAISTVSFHLKKLEAAGLVYKVKEQYYVMYHIQDNIFNLTLRELTSFENLDEYIQEERVKNFKEKVLKVFFVNNKLVKLPIQHKKRMIVLNELLKQFNVDKKYKEEEVNTIILKYYDDYCTIRRLLIEENLMFREHQIYWRNNNLNLELK